MLKDKRKSYRAPVKRKAILIHNNLSKVFLIKDISKTGLFLESVYPIEEDNVVQLLFYLDPNERAINIKARVIRSIIPSKKAEEYVSSGMGLEFLNIDFENESTIEDYLNSIYPIYEEINLLINEPKKNIDRLSFLLSKVALDNYKDFFELKENVKYICLSMGIIKQ